MSTGRPRTPEGRSVLFLITGLGRGGAETQLFRAARGLRERGWEVGIVSIMPQNRFASELRAAGIRFQDLGVPRGRPDPRAALRLWKILRRERPQVLVTFLVAANLLGPPLARLAGVPRVVSSIRLSLAAGSRRERALSLSLRASDAVVFNAATVLEETVQRGVVPRIKARLVRNGIDTVELARPAGTREQMRQSLGFGADDFVWVSVAHFRKQKNLPALVQAFGRLQEEFPQARLVLAGGHFDATEGVLQAAEGLPDRSRLHLPGRVGDVASLLLGSDAFVLPSRYEASPNALAEAMALGLPVVASNVGGVRELIASPEMGLQVDTPSAAGLAGAMRSVMEMSAAGRRAMGEAGAAHIRQTFGLEQLVDGWEAILAGDDTALRQAQGEGTPP